MTISSERLLPCPLCGGEVSGYEIPPHTHSFATFMPDHPGSYVAECPACDFYLTRPTRAETVAAWNRRSGVEGREVVHAGEGEAEPVAEGDGELDAGINYAIERLCEILEVDPKSISWDAATETMDGDVSSVLCNVLRAAYGEDWTSRPEDTARIRALFAAPHPHQAQEGMVLVPREPTMEQRKAGYKAASEARYQDPCGKTEYDQVPRAVYYAMLAASPSMERLPTLDTGSAAPQQQFREAGPAATSQRKGGE